MRPFIPIVLALPLVLGNTRAFAQQSFFKK